MCVGRRGTDNYYPINAIAIDFPKQRTILCDRGTFPQVKNDQIATI